MAHLVRLFFVLIACVAVATSQGIIDIVGQRQARTDLAGMFRTTERPETFTASHPASFFTLDMDVFTRARELPDNVPFTLRLVIPGVGPVEAIVARYRVIDEATQLTAMTANGPTRIAPPQSVLVRGYIPSLKGSFVVAAIYPEWSTMMITTGREDGEKTFIMSPIKGEGASSTMVIYDQADVPAKNEWSCHTKDGDWKPKRSRIEKSGDKGQVRYRQIKIAIECDEPYYIDHGRNLTKATQYAESVVAASSAVYERDVTATHVITQLVVWTTADPYPGTNSSQLLSQFSSRWIQNFANVDRALAHLLSGINGIGGVAYLDVLCDKTYGYAVSGLNNNITYPATGYVWDTDVFSHETGHNIGSPHTFNCWWNPPIDSCVNAEGGNCYTGTKAVKGTIMSYCHLTSQGTSLNFHPKVQALMKNQLLSDQCTPLTYELTVSMPDTIRACQSGTKTVTASATAGAEPYTYRWYSAFFDTTTTTNTFTIRQPRDFTFYLDVRDAVGNSATDTCVMRLYESPKPKLTTASLKVCAGKSADITCEVTGGRPPYNYQWLRNGVLIPTVTDLHTQRIDLPTRFTVIVSDSNGCFDSASISINVYNMQMAFSPATLSIPPLPACRNEFIQEYTLSNTGGDTLIIDTIAHGNAIKVSAPLPIILPPATTIKVPLRITVRGTGMLREDIAFIERTCQWRFRGSISGIRTLPKIFTALPVNLGTKLVCDSVTERYVVVGFNNPTSFPLEFSSVYSQSTVNTVRIQGAPFIVPPGTDRSIVIVLTSTMSQGAMTDSLSLPFESDACEGLFKIPVTLRVSSATINQPKAISFDTVRTNSRPITKSLPITATLAGTTQTTVQYVEITEPFTTSMKPGLILPHNRVTSVNVTLDPKNITAGGGVSGTLKYLLDSCAVPYTVQLNADVVVVGVDDETASAGNATVTSQDGGIAIRGFVGRADLYDLNGRRLAGRTIETSGERFDGLVAGCYVVVLTDFGNQDQRSVVTCIVR